MNAAVHRGGCLSACRLSHLAEVAAVLEVQQHELRIRRDPAGDEAVFESFANHRVSSPVLVSITNHFFSLVLWLKELLQRNTYGW